MKHARLRQDSYHLVCGKCSDQCHRKAEMSILTLYHAVFSLWLSRKGLCKGGVEVMDYHHSRGGKFCEEAILTLCCNFLLIWKCKSLLICGQCLPVLSLLFTVSSSVIGLVTNMLRTQHSRATSSNEMYFQYIFTMLGHQILTSIP